MQEKKDSPVSGVNPRDELTKRVQTRCGVIEITPTSPDGWEVLAAHLADPAFREAGMQLDRAVDNEEFREVAAAECGAGDPDDLSIADLQRVPYRSLVRLRTAYLRTCKQARSIRSPQSRGPRRSFAVGGRPPVKGSSRRSSARSGSSGDSDEPAEPSDPESPERRVCKGCGGDISHKSKPAKVCGKRCQKRVEKDREAGREKRRDNASPARAIGRFILVGGGEKHTTEAEVLATCGKWSPG
jgi:hypothetical protein